MDVFYTSGVRFAETLQTNLPGLENFWLWATFLGDPKCIFIIYFPFTYFLDQKVGIKVLWLGLISEWLNIVCKWLLFGERPFWWVLESGFSSKEEIFLRQFPATCETGPGSPSGHCMINGAALWPVVTASTAWLSRHSKSWMVKAVPFTVYLLLQLAVGISRIFILAHFPHQVIGGILVGIGLGWLLESRVPLERKLSFYLWAALSLYLSTMTTYWALLALGVDLNCLDPAKMDYDKVLLKDGLPSPVYMDGVRTDGTHSILSRIGPAPVRVEAFSGSITLATKWCTNHEWIRMETRPFSSLCRDVATVLGLGLALHSSYYTQLKDKRFSWPQRAWCASLAVIVLQLLSEIAEPQNMALWYGLSFVKYATFPWVVVALLPKAVYAMISKATQPHKD